MKTCQNLSHIGTNGIKTCFYVSYSQTVFSHFFLNTRPTTPSPLRFREDVLSHLFLPLRSKGVHCFFQQIWKQAPDFHLTYNINTRALHATKQLPSRYPFSALSLKIQRCPRSHPRCILKNIFPFFPISAGAFLVAFLICFPFTPWL